MFVMKKRTMIDNSNVNNLRSCSRLRSARPLAFADAAGCPCCICFLVFTTSRNFSMINMLSTARISAGRNLTKVSPIHT